MLLQLFVTLSHFRWHLIKFLVCFDRTTEEQFPLRILRGQEFLAVFIFDPQFTLVIRENNLGLVQIDCRALERAVVASEGINAALRTPSRFVGGTLRLFAGPHHRVMALQSFEMPENHGHLVGDVPALFIIAAVLGFLTPRRDASSLRGATA